MGVKKDLKGQRFGRLEVLEEDPIRTASGKVRWFCKCDCGRDISVIGSNLISGGSKSCRYCPTELHGLHKHPLYKVFHKMKARCYNPNQYCYENYGGRGITICDYWLEDFMNFYNDMKEGYKKGLQIDRIDNDKGYSPENCRWATRSQNAFNRRGLANTTSKYKGVFYREKENKYTAEIRFGGVKRYLGIFKDEVDAAIAYNNAAIELSPDFACLNKIEN